MKLLLYSRSFFPAIGGIETITLELARGIVEATDARKIDLTVVTETAGSEEQDGKLPFAIIRRPGFRRLAKLLKEADVVHVAGPAMMPLALGLILGKPVIVEHHGFQVACPNGQLLYEPERKNCEGHYMAGHYSSCLKCNASNGGAVRSAKLLFLTPLRRFLSNRVSVNVTPTDSLARTIRLKRMETVYHGLSGVELQEPPLPATVFAFQGRLVSTKGVATLLEAAKQLQAKNLSFALKIIGDGPERGNLEKLAVPLGDKVQFLGHVSNDRLSDALSDVSTVVMPSLAGEVFGLVAAENMFRGKALLVSDVGPLSEVVGDAGIVTPIGDASALATAMRRVIESPCSAEALGKRARERATKLFDLGRMIESHVRIYQHTFVAPEPRE